MNALQSLVASESRLVAGINAATAAVSQIGTSRVDAALADLSAACAAAQARLTHAMHAMESIIGFTTAAFGEQADAVEADLAAMTAPSSVAPVVVVPPAPVAPLAIEAPVEAPAEPEPTVDTPTPLARTRHTHPCPDCRGTGDETSDGQGTCSTCRGKGIAPAPVNRIADVVDAIPPPSANGRKPRKAKR